MAARDSWPAPPAYYRDAKRRRPPKPPDGEIQMFGIKRPALGTKPPVAELEEQLYTAATEAESLSELRRLNRSTLDAFLGLLRTAQEAPTQCADEGALRPPV